MIPVRGFEDKTVAVFGLGRTGLTAARATDPARHAAQMNAIVVAPQTTSWINMWGQGTATPSFEYNFVYFEF